MNNVNISYSQIEIEEAIKFNVNIPNPNGILINSNYHGDDKRTRDYQLPLVSICVCMKNAASFIDETLLSVVLQSYNGPLELSIYDDVSTDSSVEKIKSWQSIFDRHAILLQISSANYPTIIYHHNIDYYKSLIIINRNNSNIEVPEKEKSKGVGYSRNRAIESSYGEYLCILDADDIMICERVQMQLEKCRLSDNHTIKDDQLTTTNNNDKQLNHSTIVGSNFMRIPSGSSARYTEWCNRLTQQDLYLHQYRECTLIQPTWFMHRSIYDRNGGFVEPSPQVYKNLYQIQIQSPDNKQEQQETKSQPIPEDLLFFHKHLDNGGLLSKVDKPLVIYRYHPDNLSKQIHRLVLLKIRLEHLERRVLSKWSSFSIWGCGRDGKKFFTMLSHESKDKVTAFCDVDVKKIGTNYHCSHTGHNIPIIHFSQVKPPVILCVCLDRTNTEFESNIDSLGLQNGIDYWHFN